MYDFSSNQKIKVAVAMSGGVDSSVAAALLVNMGYQVMGIMMKLWDSDPDLEASAMRQEAMIKRARDVAARLDIPLEVIDLVTEFRRKVVNYFLSSHQLGQTPNPCFVCNQAIKWGVLLNEAKNRGADFLATGHYARIIRNENGIIELHKGEDSQKDQSYVLAGLTQEQLSSGLLPLGDKTKLEVREIAHSYGFANYNQEESQDLCFLGGIKQDQFLEIYAPDLYQKGLIKNRQGEKLGEHNGLAGYTIGQRKGLGAGYPEPVYVLEKNLVTNELVIGVRSELGSKSITLGEINWTSGVRPEVPAIFQVKIRYKAIPMIGKLILDDNNKYKFLFNDKVRDATPGQFAVLYDGEKVMGSGIIQEVHGEVQ